MEKEEAGAALMHAKTTGRCDILAEGLIKAARQVEIKVPLIIRLEGTNVARGRELLQQSGLDFLVAPTMGEAARKVGELVRDDNQ